MHGQGREHERAGGRRRSSTTRPRPTRRATLARRAERERLVQAAGHAQRDRDGRVVRHRLVRQPQLFGAGRSDAHRVRLVHRPGGEHEPGDGDDQLRRHARRRRSRPRAGLPNGNGWFNSPAHDLVRPGRRRHLGAGHVHRCRSPTRGRTQRRCRSPARAPTRPATRAHPRRATIKYDSTPPTALAAAGPAAERERLVSAAADRSRSRSSPGDLSGPDTCTAPAGYSGPDAGERLPLGHVHGQGGEHERAGCADVQVRRDRAGSVRRRWHAAPTGTAGTTAPVTLNVTRNGRHFRRRCVHDADLQRARRSNAAGLRHVHGPGGEHEHAGVRHAQVRRDRADGGRRSGPGAERERVVPRAAHDLVHAGCRGTSPARTPAAHPSATPGPDDASASRAGTCTDVAGNTSAPAALTFKYDATPPSASGGLDRPPDSNGWYNHAGRARRPRRGCNLRDRLLLRARRTRGRTARRSRSPAPAPTGRGTRTERDRVAEVRRDAPDCVGLARARPGRRTAGTTSPSRSPSPARTRRPGSARAAAATPVPTERRARPPARAPTSPGTRAARSRPRSTTTRRLQRRRPRSHAPRTRTAGTTSRSR